MCVENSDFKIVNQETPSYNKLFNFLFIFPLKRGKILQDSHFSAVNWSNMYPAVAWKCPQILVIKAQHNLWGGSRWPLSECGLPFPLPNLVR